MMRFLKKKILKFCFAQKLSTKTMPIHIGTLNFSYIFSWLNLVYIYILHLNIALFVGEVDKIIRRGKGKN